MTSAAPSRDPNKTSLYEITSRPHEGESEDPYTHRKDWKAPEYNIGSAHLVFDIRSQTSVAVRATLNVCRNQELEPEETPGELVLDCHEGLDVTHIAINGVKVTEDQFTRDSRCIRLNTGTAENFTLTVATEINPQANKTGLGLYGDDTGAIYVQSEPEAFRKVIPFVDAQSNVVKTWTTEIIGDPEEYPTMLANGALSNEEDLEDGRRKVVFENNRAMPSYLFALAAGKLVCGAEDTYTTGSGREIKLQVYADEQNKDNCDFAMFALKESLAYSEKTGGMECGLDEYKMVASPGFTFGAMEGSGLNLFTPVRTLLNPQISRAEDFIKALGTIGHEVCHDQTGNTVTVESTFDVAGKEGITCFRDQEFLAHMLGDLGYLSRIQTVKELKDTLFPKDRGTTSKAIVLDKYSSPWDCYYADFAYRKAAEVVRMMKVFLGDEQFGEGLIQYLEDYKGQAVKTEVLAKVMSEIGGFDYEAFIKWYHQKGTPSCEFSGQYDPAAKTYTLEITQTQAYPESEALYFPVKVALLGQNGEELPLQLEDDSKAWDLERGVLLMDSPRQVFTFTNLEEAPVPSMFRDLSAPVQVEGYTSEETAFLMKNDTNEVNRYDASQKIAKATLIELVQKHGTGETMEVPENVLAAYESILNSQDIHPGLLAEMLKMPSIGELLATKECKGKLDATLTAQQTLQRAIYNRCSDRLGTLYDESCQTEAIQDKNGINPEAIARTSLKNICLKYLAPHDLEKGFSQYEQSNNMTDWYEAFVLVCSSPNSDKRTQVVEDFYKKCKDNPVSMILFATGLAVAERDNTDDLIEDITALREREAFNKEDVRQIEGIYIKGMPNNEKALHDMNGKGYEVMVDAVIELTESMPKSASGILDVLIDSYATISESRQQLMRSHIDRLRTHVSGKETNSQRSIAAKLEEQFYKN